ncbi:MAG TPA: LysM domain-containing protein, partial [Anaerolineae bacterium]|nr:LysM domain-containing protein [Anaerolineae bacterium]
TATALPTATEPPTPVPPTATPRATQAPPTPTQAPATATPQAAAAAAAAAGGGLTHTVQAGDNWFSIARRYGVTQEALAAYNNSRPSDILQVAQVLRVPAAGTVVSPPPSTPTPVRPTAVPPTATPTAPATTPTTEIPAVAALAAPSLLAPMTGDGFTAETLPVLTWRPVSGLGPEDYYYVIVRFTMRDGQQSRVDDRVTSTSYTVPIWVHDVAAPPDRLGVWSVQVRRMGPGNREIEVSPPSENRTFYWR